MHIYGCVCAILCKKEVTQDTDRREEKCEVGRSGGREEEEYVGVCVLV